jgi:hypothetical protein
LSESDLKEFFALFTSVTKCEKRQFYDPTNDDHFLNTNLAEEYSLTEEKREYALDAWQAGLYPFTRLSARTKFKPDYILQMCPASALTL